MLRVLTYVAYSFGSKEYQYWLWVFHCQPFPIRNQGRSHSLEDLASPSGAVSLQASNKSPRLQRTMSVNQRSSPRSRFSVQENRFSFNNRGECWEIKFKRFKHISSSSILFWRRILLNAKKIRRVWYLHSSKFFTKAYLFFCIYSHGQKFLESEYLVLRISLLHLSDYIRVLQLPRRGRGRGGLCERDRDTHLKIWIY